MSDQVHYHQINREPIVLHIVGGDAKNKTVNLAREPGGTPIIEGIALSEEAGDGNGRAVLITEAPKAKAGKAKASKAKEPSEAQEPEPSTESEESPPAGDDGTSSAPPDN